MRNTLFSIILTSLLFSSCGESSVENIALNKQATATSNYDYNLTAQLITDGITITSEPSWLKVSTAQGELPKREKEWTIDKGPFSASRLEGKSNFLEYKWSNESYFAKVVRVTGTVAFESDGSPAQWSIKCLASSAGNQIKNVGGISGKGLPGMAYGTAEYDDPNKNEGSVTLPQRLFVYEIPLDCVDFNYFKIEFDMSGAKFWKINSVDFATDSFGKNTDSGHFYDSKESRGFSVIPSESFTSAWMSADADPQSIVVDLGHKARIFKVTLHWIHKCDKGTVEVSKDGVHWTVGAKLPATTDLEYSVPCAARARYIRLNISGADTSGHFCLSEMEVLGRPHKKVRSDWYLQRASLVDADGESIASAGFQFKNWIPAEVPGTVLYNYINAGAIPDPALSDYNQQISESFFNGDFWYRGVVSASGEGTRKFLEFDGINWKAEVFFNGNYLGRIDGAFKRASFDVTDIVLDENVVAVHVIKNANYGAVKEKNMESPDFNGGVLGADNPTFHATVGWDWIPTVRGREIGIWNDVRLVGNPGWKIANALVESKVSPDGKVSVKPTVEVSNYYSNEITGLLKGAIGDVVFEQRISVPACETSEVTFDPAEFSKLRDCKLALWWPNDMGEAVLHDAWYTFVPDGSEEGAHDLEYKAGIREFKYVDEMTDLKIYVNNRRFMPKGGNWGFSEYNLQYTDKYDIAVANHRDMHLNMIRNWVGQTGDEEFYEVCDKYGVVVWQDFWLANPADGPDPDDPEMFLDNAQDYVRRIRSHASIGLYCGRNEGYPPVVLNEGLKKITSRLHPGIVYIPNSADDGVSGHGPYRAVNPDEYFRTLTTKFHSERGMPAVMTYDNLEKLFDGTPSWPNDDVWGQHDFTMTGAQGDVAFLEMVKKGFGPDAMSSPEQFAYYAQWINYDGYRAMYEANNVVGKGLLIWMSHSCWPSLAWQTYDYWFGRNGAYFGTKKACEPLHIQFNPAKKMVQVVNYTGFPTNDITAAVYLKDVDGNDIFSKNVQLSIDGDNVEDVIDCSDVPDGPCFVYLLLSDDKGNKLSDNIYMKNFKDGVNTGDYTGFSQKSIHNLFSLCF